MLINASYAWLYGCGGVNGTLLGFGERTGNTPLEGMKRPLGVNVTDKAGAARRFLPEYFPAARAVGD